MAPKTGHLVAACAEGAGKNDPERQDGDSNEMVGLVGIEEWNFMQVLLYL